MKTKSKVIRVCSLVLLSVAVSTALVGCGSKSEKDTTASSTTSTSKVVKSSAKTKTSEKKSAKKAKTEASASKDSQGQEEVSAPEASSSKNQASAGNDAQAETNGSAASESNKSSQATADTQSDAPVPAALVGTWTGTSPQERTLVLQLMLMATSLQRQISMSITNPIVKAQQQQKPFKFLEISTFGRVAIFLPCFLVLQE